MEEKSDWLKEIKGTAGQEAVPVAEAHLGLAAAPAPGAGSPTAALVAAVAHLTAIAVTAANQDLWVGLLFKTNLKSLLLHLGVHLNHLHLLNGKDLGRDPDLLIAETELFIRPPFFYFTSPNPPSKIIEIEQEHRRKPSVDHWDRFSSCLLIPSTCLLTV